MPQIVKTEISNFRPFEQILETSFHSLPSALRPWLRRKNPILTNHRGIPPHSPGQFWGIGT